MKIKDLRAFLDFHEKGWKEETISMLGKYEDQNINLGVYKFDGLRSDFVGYDSDSVVAFWDVTGLGIILETHVELDISELEE